MSTLKVDQIKNIVESSVVDVSDIASKNAFNADTGASLVGFKANGTGAVATTVQAKLRESVSVKDFGAVGDGVADDTAAFVAAVTASKVVIIPSGMTLSISNVSIATDLHLVIEQGATLKHHTSSDAYMLQSTAALSITGGGKIHGNRTQQSVRSRAIRFNGTSLYVSNIEFVSTYGDAIQALAATKKLTVSNCQFSDMAEHGGVLGQDSRAIYVGDCPVVTISDNEFRAALPSVAGRSPGGIQVAVSDTAIYASACNITGNYFENIGQDSSGNFLGCIDLYTNATNSRVTGNFCKNPMLTALKLNNLQNIVCADNVISGFGGITATSKPMITVGYSRPVPYASKQVVIANNIVNLGTDTTQICIDIVGSFTDPLYPMNGAVISGNSLNGGARGIILYGVKDVAITGNVITNSAHAIRFIEMNQLGGSISIVGNTIKTCQYGLLALATAKMLNFIVDISSNIFVDNTTACVLIASDASNVLHCVKIEGNAFIGAPAAAPALTVTQTSVLLVNNNAGIPAQPVAYSTITSYMENGNSWNAGLRVKDGVTAPTTEVGVSTIYVDSADGDLKVKFGDGIIKTIATDV